MICLSTHFFYDGIDSKRFNVGLFREDSNISNSIGLNQTINDEKVTSGNMRYFRNVDRSPSSMEFLIAKYDSVENKILPLTTPERIKIMGWLIKDHPCEFIDMNDQDLKVYCTFKSADIETNKYLEGYLKVTMEIFTPYQYLNGIYYLTVKDEDNKEIEIYNKSNVENYVYPIIEVNSTSDLGYFEIENLNTHEKLKVIGGQGKYKIYNFNGFIDGDYTTYEGDYISLKKGLNTLKFTGLGSYVIKVANPMSY